mmetsp:Transcript_23621/g.35461  ORF Transcript_23621/g.35461 Transcript_23621/m.35461 type:complete len:369 (-) Transcript_23621:219-1325(-)
MTSNTQNHQQQGDSSTLDDDDDTTTWRTIEPMALGGRLEHGCCSIDEHRMILVGGLDILFKRLSSGAIYDVRTKQWTSLPNDMPVAIYCCRVVCDGSGAAHFVYVVGGRDQHGAVDTLLRLSLDTYEWTIMSPMSTARRHCAVVMKDDYIYAFGGQGSGILRNLSSAERYSVADDSWEPLPDIATRRCGHCAVLCGSDVYIVGGGQGVRSVEVFDTVLQKWKTEKTIRDMPDKREYAAATVLKDRYLFVFGGRTDTATEPAKRCLIYDCIFNRWSSTPASIVVSRIDHSVAVLDGKIIVAGGINRGYSRPFSSLKLICSQSLLEYAPLIYPLPRFYYNQLLVLGKHDDSDDDVSWRVSDTAPRKKRKV